MSILDKLPSVIKKEIDSSDVKSDIVAADKPFLIIHSRDVEPAEKDLLKTYGSVLEWDSSFQNIPLKNHKFDYCLLDIHSKDVRMLLMKTDLTAYHTVILSKKWQSEDDFIDDVKAENVLRSLPPRQAFKPDFDKLLLSAKIRSPSCAKAFLRVFLKVLTGYSDK